MCTNALEHGFVRQLCSSLEDLKYDIARSWERCLSTEL